MRMVASSTMQRSGAAALGHGGRTVPLRTAEVTALGAIHGEATVIACFVGHLAETWAPDDPPWVRAGPPELPCLMHKGRPGGS